MNNCMFIGRIVNDIEVKESDNGKKSAYLTVAVPRSYKNADGEYDTDFINCVLFGNIAERTSEFCKKGDMVALKGRMESYSYETKDGDKKYGQNVVAEKISFLCSKSKEINDKLEQDNSEMEM